MFGTELVFYLSITIENGVGAKIETTGVRNE